LEKTAAGKINPGQPSFRQRTVLDLYIAQVFDVAMLTDYPEFVAFDWDIGNREKNAKHDENAKSRNTAIQG